MRRIRRLLVVACAALALHGGRASMGAEEKDSPIRGIAVGDLNGDGTPDIAVGLPDIAAGGLAEAGEVRAFSGTDGRLLWKLPGKSKEESYGYCVETIGDVDGDGATDLGIPSGFAKPWPRLDIVSGRSGKILRSEEAKGADGRSRPGGMGWVATVGDGSGKAPVDLLIADFDEKCIAYVDPSRPGRLSTIGNPGITKDIQGVGDIDGDGSADFAVGDTLLDADGRETGSYIRVHSGAKCRAGKAAESGILDVRGGIGKDHVGSVLGPAGDWDADGKGDLLAGRWGNEKSKEPWLVRVLSGRDGAELWRVAGEKADVGLGGAVAVGDIDGDGKPDLAVASPGRRGKSGAVHVRSGGVGGILWTVTGGGGDWFGHRLLSVPDVDADHVPDLCVVAPWQTTGRVQFLSGKTGKVLRKFGSIL